MNIDYSKKITLTMPIKVTISPGEQESTRSSINSTSTERGMRPISYTIKTKMQTLLEVFYCTETWINYKIACVVLLNTN